ncbi:TolC family protein [Sphingomonas sp. 4RDLI-65]|uniref:TolC family protein n=1 Tax=Sphingomonas sp. 4RDLI-65 TaxID=3111641 RepID=UPI003C185007
MYHIVATVLVAGACASSLQAQGDLPSDPGSSVAAPVLTLADALIAAGATSPAIEASQSGLRAAAAQRAIAGLRPNPSFDAMSENVAGSGAYRGLRAAETTVGVSLPIELGGKRGARVAVADAMSGRADLQTAIAQADLRLRVTQAYIDAVANQRRAATARDQRGIAAEVLLGARVRVRAGRASPLEEQRADVARLAAEGAVERAERSAQVAVDTLARLTGRPAASLDVGWFDRVARIGPERPVETGSTLATMAARTDVSIATAQVQLARSQRIPDLTLGAAARRLSVSNDVAGVFSLSVPLPFFNGGRAAVDMATAQRDQADANRRVALLEADQAIASARVDAANAATTARTATGPMLAAAQEATRIARIGYREGKFGQLDLLEAERALAETRTTAIDALASYHDAEARLDRLVAPAPQVTKDAR